MPTIELVKTAAVESLTLSATHDTLPEGKWETLDGSRFDSAPEFIQLGGMVFKLREVEDTEEGNTNLWHYDWFPRSAMQTSA